MKRSNVFRIAVISIIVLLIILLLRNCSGDSTTERAEDFKINQAFLSIPPEATFIAVFNTFKILQGVGFNELRGSQEYIDQLRAYYNQNPPFARVFSDPKGVGIDVQKKSVFYLAVGTDADEVYTNTIFSLADLKAFEESILKSNKGKYKDNGNFKYLKIDPTSSVGWNDKFVSFISTDPSYDKMKIFDRCFTDSKTKYFDNHNKFNDYILGSKADFAFWGDFTSYSKNQLHATGDPGKISSLLLKGNVIYGDATFEKGKIDANVKFEFNSFLDAAQDKIFKNGYDTKVLALMPEKVPSMLLNTSLNIEGILSVILKDIDLKVEARNSLASYGLTLDDLTKALDGDMLIAGYPSIDKGKSSTVFAVKIKDHVHFDVLLQIWQDLGEIEMEDANLYRINKGVPPFFPIAATYSDKLQRLYVKGDYAYVSLDNIMIEHIASGQESMEFTKDLLIDKNEADILFSGYIDNRIDEVNKITKEYSIREVKFNYENKSLALNFQFENSEINPLRQIFNLK